MNAEKLKKSILQYAIQGKLVPQLPMEEPASVLLQKIKKEKQELIKQGKLKKEKPLAPITDDEIPFDIPESWQWVRYGTIAYLHTGDSINAEEKKKKFTNLTEGFNYIATKDVGFNGHIDYLNGVKIPYEANFEVAKKGGSLICIEGGSAGRKIGLLNEDVCFGNKLCSFEPIIIDYKFLYFTLQSPLFIENFSSNKTGMIGGVGVNQLKNLIVGLPPFEEQKRIVAKIEELMVFIDKYDKYQTELEKLEKQFPERLKKSILQYALQGKLVPQLPTEESASVLLQKIKKEKQELIKQGKLKKEKPLAPITDDEISFDIPDSWVWVRLGEIEEINPKNKINDDLLVSFIPMSLLENGFKNGYSYETKKWGQIKQNFTHLKTGDVCIAKITPCFENRKSAVMLELENGYGAGTTELHVLRQFGHLENKYVLYFVKNNDFILEGKKSFTGTAGQQRVGKKFIEQYPTPLPPLNEQKRIVAKIEELFALVDLISVGKKYTPKEESSMSKVIQFNTLIQKPKAIDLSNIKIAARAQGGIKQETLAAALSQIEKYYDDKN